MSIDRNEHGARDELAEALWKLRKAAGLSGERLAVRCHMSQAKISRIERGKVLPTVLDVERILTALDVPADAAQKLVGLARRANVEHTSWRTVAEGGFWRKQDELKAIAESCAVQRLFLPAIPSGLLQVAEYARHALSPVVASSPVRDVDRALVARLARQTVLDDADRQFVFVLTEQAVRWKRAGRHVMAEQCARLAELADRPNIDMAVIPLSAQILGAPLNTFVVYDDRLVIAELFSGEVVLRDYKDVTHHLDLFNFFYGHALKGDRARSFLLDARDEFM
ncbi:helix-turn-helix domain-containing protein [Amycolatopsis sp. NPDC059021]|uniref:helix-turn-helix domain-containing protein n=1 Tax=Amycolatopsis sp. NPDC059021 TaxID=3346704 RepID=UPI00366ED222